MKPNAHTTAALAILALVLFPRVASANAGTPLMLSTAAHLAFGNFFIGIVEGLLLGVIFRVSKVKCVGMLILANYASAWLGYLFITGKFFRIEVMIETVQSWFWIFVGLTFLLTLVVEFPFFLLAFRGKENVLRRSAFATLLIHGISYTLLLGWYWSVSETSMMSELEVVPADHFQISEPYDLYYITSDGTAIVRSDLQGKTHERVKEVRSRRMGDRLFARPSDEGGYDLLLRVAGSREEPVLDQFAAMALTEESVTDEQSDRPVSKWPFSQPVPKLTDSSDWEYANSKFYSEGGIYGVNVANQAEFQFAMELPYASWMVRNATHIEGDHVVFQLGKDQICILQPQQKRIALIARGKGPVVAKAWEGDNEH